MERSISEGVLTTIFGDGRGGSVKKKYLKLPQTGGSPDGFFVRQDKNIYQDGFQKKITGRDKSISEGVTRTSLGNGRGGSVEKQNLKLLQTGGSPGDYFARQQKIIQTSPNSGKSPGEKLTRPDINNR